MTAIRDKLDVARSLREIGALLQYKGENSYKTRAYENGSASIEAVSEDLGRLVEEGRLTEVPGIGPSLASVISEMVRTGRSSLLEKLRAEAPPGALELSGIQGLNPKKIQALHDTLGIGSVEDLRQACLAGRVRSVRGFGAKTEQSLLDAISRSDAREERVLLVDALAAAEPLLAHLCDFASTSSADLAGEARRRCETMLGVDIIVASEDAAAVLEHAERFPRVTRVRSRSEGRIDLFLAGDVPASVHVVPPSHYAAARLALTGSQAHLVELAAVAAERGVDFDTNALAGMESEEKIYASIGLHPVPPELREGDGEIDAARRGGFDHLVTLDDIQGMVHCHTVFSDGNDTIEDMARAAEAMGMKYITITDHSPAAHYAKGVEIDRLERQWDEIARVQERVNIKILRGTESDILADGALDYPDRILERLDVVIASVHSRMKMDEAAMTERLVEAMRKPVFKIWGHPLGRLLLRREPFACRVEEVLDVIASSRAAIEVNGDPHRLDMEARWLKEARKRKIRFVISTDAHSIGGFSSLRFGVAMARRGGLGRDEVLNTLGPEGFHAAVKPIP
jgi:DNA polymerase (family X)